MAGTAASTFALVLLVMLGGCSPPVDVSADAEVAVRAADIAWAHTFARKDLEGYMDYVEPSASIQQPNGPTVTGTDAIRVLVESFFALPNLDGTWYPTYVEAARSGDLAYSTGTYIFHFTDTSGSQVTEQGKYLEVWRKQADGSWKMRAESFNSDQPLPEVASE